MSQNWNPHERVRVREVQPEKGFKAAEYQRRLRTTNLRRQRRILWSRVLLYSNQITNANNNKKKSPFCLGCWFISCFPQRLHGKYFLSTQTISVLEKQHKSCDKKCADLWSPCSLYKYRCLLISITKGRFQCQNASQHLICQFSFMDGHWTSPSFWSPLEPPGSMSWLTWMLAQWPYNHQHACALPIHTNLYNTLTCHPCNKVM